MSTKKTYYSIYKEEYFEGYSRGINPLLQTSFCQTNSEAFNSGFATGRMDYEEMNGSISEGIPQQIITNKILEDFLLSGLLGLSIDTTGYTSYQLKIIDKWYQSGIEKFDANQSIYLFKILQQDGIQLS